MKKVELILLLLVLVVAFVVRLYKINRPIADWHSWRQADTAAVSRNFIKYGFNPFIPTFDDLSSQTNGIDNPKGYRFVEFPIYNTVVFGVWKITGVNEMYARLVTVIATLISTYLLFAITKYFSGWKTGLLAAFFFATIPYNIFYSSTILPGPFMVTAVLALYLSFIKYLENRNIGWLVLSILFANTAILSWPIALFFMIPVLYLALEKYRMKILREPKIWIFGMLSVLPFLLWRIWILNFPAGIPNWKFLLNEGNIRFKGAFFRWLLVERIGKLILTVSGFALFTLGAVLKPQKEKLFYLSMLLSIALYFSVFSSGNVRHDYYQIPIIPSLAIFMALGTNALIFSKNQLINKQISILVAISLIVFMYAFGFYEVQGYYWVNKPQILEAGKAVDKELPKDATVIAPYNGDTAFLYQTNRRGYPLVDRPLEKFIDSGTKYLVSVDVGDAGIQNLAKNCRLVDHTSDYLIIEMDKNCVGK